jgi:GNAT superfamily N-acetyltransferase
MSTFDQQKKTKTPRYTFRPLQESDKNVFLSGSVSLCGGNFSDMGLGKPSYWQYTFTDPGAMDPFRGREPIRIFVDNHKKEIVGGIMYHWDDGEYKRQSLSATGELKINLICVKPSARGHKYGQRMIKNLIKVFKTKYGVSDFVVTAELVGGDGFEARRATFETLGFAPLDNPSSKIEPRVKIGLRVA